MVGRAKSTLYNLFTSFDKFQTTWKFHKFYDDCGKSGTVDHLGKIVRRGYSPLRDKFDFLKHLSNKAESNLLEFIYKIRGENGQYTTAISILYFCKHKLCEVAKKLLCRQPLQTLDCILEIAT